MAAKTAKPHNVNIRMIYSCVFADKNICHKSSIESKFNTSNYIKRYFTSFSGVTRSGLSRKKTFFDYSNVYVPNANRTQSQFFQTSATSHKKDYYSILGVAKGATTGDLKKSYYQLAKKFHPDTNKEANAAEKFQEIQQAYEILSDKNKRAAYDQYGQTDFNGTGGGADPFGAGSEFHGMNVNDIFKQFFGERAGGFSTSHGFEGFGASQNYMLNLSFMDAVRGVSKDIRVRLQSLCKRCKGNKAEPGSTLKTCPTCQGTGEENVSTGFFNMRSTCSRCKGHGTFISDPCRTCNGKGSVMESKTITIPVPAGVDEGQTVRVPVSYGELFVTFKVAKSEIFERNGADVTSNVFVSFAQAMMGGAVKTTGLDGDFDLTIQPGTQSHQQMRIIGKGINRLSGNGRGDHYINIKIHIPKYLTQRQKEIIKEFAELDNSYSGSVRGVVRGGTKEKNSDWCWSKGEKQ